MWRERQGQHARGHTPAPCPLPSPPPHLLPFPARLQAHPGPRAFVWLFPGLGTLGGLSPCPPPASILRSSHFFLSTKCQPWPWLPCRVITETRYHMNAQTTSPRPNPVPERWPHLPEALGSGRGASAEGSLSWRSPNHRHPDLALSSPSTPHGHTPGLPTPQALRGGAGGCMPLQLSAHEASINTGASSNKQLRKSRNMIRPQLARGRQEGGDQRGKLKTDPVWEPKANGNIRGTQRAPWGRPGPQCRAGGQAGKQAGRRPHTWPGLLYSADHACSLSTPPPPRNLASFQFPSTPSALLHSSKHIRAVTAAAGMPLA